MGSSSTVDAKSLPTTPIMAMNRRISAHDGSIVPGGGSGDKLQDPNHDPMHAITWQAAATSGTTTRLPTNDISPPGYESDSRRLSISPNHVLNPSTAANLREVISRSRSSSRSNPIYHMSASESDLSRFDLDEQTGEKIDHRKRKRNRTIQSCLPCHQNKRKCDRKRPCSRCTALGLTGSCVYEVDHARNPDDPEQTENEHLRGRIAELEQVVRELRQKGSSKATSGTPVGGSVKESSEPAEKKRRMIVDRYARFKLDEAHHGMLAKTAIENAMAAENYAPGQEDPMMNFGNPSRKSSFEHAAEPYVAHISSAPGEELVGDAQGREAYVGGPGGRSMLRRLAEITASNVPDSADKELLEIPEDVAFSGFFPDMRKTFPFTTIWSHENFIGEIIGLLPTQKQSEYLWTSFEEEVAIFFCPWFEPDLKAEFQGFFAKSQEEKTATPLASLSLYLMICALGIMVRASEKEIFGRTRHREVDEQEEKTDLTCSRLQSEIYRESNKRIPTRRPPVTF